jgi:site-specific recombinase XerD
MNPDESKYYPYKEAQLVHYNYSTEKKWFIKFYAWDVKLGRLRRKRLSEFNVIDDIEQRKAYCNKKITKINDMLAKGFHFDELKLQEKKREAVLSRDKFFITIDGAIKKILSIRGYSQNTYNSYKSVAYQFIDFLKKTNSHNLNVQDLNKTKVQEYADELIKKKYTGITINKKISYMKAIFNELADREIINTNPFVGLKKQKEIITEQNIAYNDTQIRNIREHVITKDPQLWIYIQFIFYGYIRPNEIRQLRIKHIHLKANRIYVPALVSKTRFDRYIEVTDHFKRTLNEMQIDKYDQNDYIFSADLTPGKNQLSKNVMAARYRSLLNDLGIAKEYTLYSWKHTGVVKAYLAGVGIEAIRIQCGHINIQTTMVYLKSLGLLGNVEFRQKFAGICL